MEQLATIIITALISSLFSFIISDFFNWKISSRKDKLEEKKKLLEELWSPLITILNWMSIRSTSQLNTEEVSDSISPLENDKFFFVFHPHQYEKLWSIRSRYRYMFTENKDPVLFKIDQIFLNLKLFKHKNGIKERWIYQISSREEGEKTKNEYIEYLNSQIEKISKEINNLQNVFNNLCRFILYLVVFWKI